MARACPTLRRRSPGRVACALTPVLAACVTPQDESPRFWHRLAAIFVPALLALPLAMPAGGRTWYPMSLPADKMLIRRLFGIGIMALSVFWGCPVVGQVFYVGGEGGWTHLLVKRSFDEASESSAGPVPGIGVQD